LPIATTSWPTRSRRESPSWAEAAPVGEGRLDLAGAADDVAVGQYIGVGSEDDAGTGAARALLGAADLQVKDRRADAIDRADHGA
jgi:hypothetical protein